jgi:Ca2+-binding RTX toxin-like protein
VAAGTLVYTATSTDSGDISTGSTTYSLTGTDASAFGIDASTGAVTINASPNYEVQSSYSFSVVATDAAGNASEQDVALLINNLDEVAPTITSGDSASVSENVAAGTLVYTATSTDSGDISTGSSTYSLTGTDASAFGIDASTGAVTINASPNYEVQSSYSFSVAATDAAGNATSKAVTLSVTALEEIAPTLIITDSNDGTVNIADGAVNFNLTFSEAVTGFDASKVTVGNGSKGSFSGSGTTYTLVVTPTASSAGNITIDVSTTGVTDAAGNQATPPAQYTQVFDTSAPNAPVLTLGTGVANGATSAEATTSGGVVTLIAESGSSVAVSFTCGSNTLTKTVAGNGTTAVPVVLTPADLSILGNGNVSVSATASDSAGNASSAGTTSFQLDTVAPLFISGPDPIDVSNITFTTNMNGQAALYNADSTTLFLTGVTANTSTTLTLVAQASLTTATLKFTDGAGNLTAAAPIFLLGTSSADLINGTNAADFLYGFAGNDRLFGGSGNDILNGGAGTDTLIGGLGNDTYIVDSLTDTINEDLGAGIDTVLSSLTYTLGANLESLTLTGSAAVNGTGNSLNNVITGNGAKNILNGGAGIDSLIGGLGNDTYIIDSLTDTINEDLGAGIDTVLSSLTYTLGANLESLTLTGSAVLSGTGNSLNNVITGNAGANILSGEDGNDKLNGDAGADSLIGGLGNDNLNGGAGADSLIGGLGNDSYLVDNIGDLVIELANEGIDQVATSINYSLVGTEIESLTLTGTADLIGTGNAYNNSLTGNTGANILSGDDGNDNLNGGAGADSLIGGLGNDNLNGGAGADSLIGGLGNDSYLVDNIGDLVIELTNEGIDKVTASLNYSLAGTEIENLTLTGTADLIGTGNAYNNSFTGNAGANILSGEDGNDKLNGGSGNDTLIGGTGLDVVTGGAGSDTFSYAAGDALISGTTSLSFARITDFSIGTDSLDGANAVSAYNLRKLGSVGTSLRSTTISSLLTTTSFTANGASAFTFGAGSGLRTFLALNDANAGFQTSTDNIIEITGYTGVLNNLAII